MASTKSQDDYQELEQRDACLKNPDMYIGDVENDNPRDVTLFLDGKITTQKVTHPYALDHLFVEVLGNAADNVWESREAKIDPKQIEVTMDSQSCTVRNYGLGIPIVKKGNLWVPEMIFSRFLSGSNFNKNKGRYSIGKNGVGAKATNVFSKTFVVKCGDADRKLRYTQIFSDNMGKKSEPEIVPYQGENFVEITFSPDFSRFKGVTEYTSINLGITIYYAISISFTYDIPVVVNGVKYHIRNIEEYAKLHFDKLKAGSYISHRHEEKNAKGEPTGSSSEIFIADTPCQGIMSAFVNGIPTPKGGVHVKALYATVIPKIVEILGKEADGVEVTKTHLKKHLSIFINCRLKDPRFGGQTKEELTSPTPKIEIPEDQLKKIKKWTLLEYVHQAIKATQLNKLKQTDGGKSSAKIKDKNLVGSNWAGKAKKDLTTLVYVEGESAAGYWSEFLSLVPNGEGHDYYGTLMGHGKIINVLTADFQQLLNNRDIELLKRALGLKEGTDYDLPANMAKLHYGRVLISTDADNDGIHILCLLLVFFAFKFPGLLRNGYINFYRTPIYRLRKGNKVICFYTETSFEKYCESHDTSGWKVKRYKGLATSGNEDILEDYEKKMVVKLVLDDKALENLRINFSSASSDDRKTLLLNWMDSNIPDLSPYTELTISDILQYEFPLYIKESLIRHIPHHLDGLKDSQRKAVFAMFELLTGKKESKVEYLASDAAKITGYTHGASSLANTIIHMAQNFFSTNNLPIFTAQGRFGSREMGNREAGAPRYTAVSRPEWIPFMFRKEDIPLLVRIHDVEGDDYEPETYFPVLPLHIINGADGVGTGYRTFIPKHNPLDVALWLKQRMHGGELPFVPPWYRGFKGTFRIKGAEIRSYGVYENRPDKLTVSELPVGKCNKAYLEVLDEMEEAKIIDDYQNKCTTKQALVYIKGFKHPEGINHKTLHLITRFSYKTMNVLIPTEKNKFRIHRFENVQELLEHFYQERLKVYQQRKEYHLQAYLNEIAKITERIRFIRAVNEKELTILKRPRNDIYADMERMKFDRALLKAVSSEEYSDEGILHHQEEIEKCRRQYQELSGTSPEQLWEHDIDELVHHLIKKEKFEPRTLADCAKDKREMIKDDQREDQKEDQGEELIDLQEE